MTSPSWKNPQTTRWSILQRNRLEGLASALLLAVSASWATSTLADEPAAAPVAPPNKQESPLQRWERVKAQADTASQAEATPKSTSKPGIILPLPDEDDIAIVPSELKLAPALPTATEEPRWIVPARPIPAAEELVPTPDPVEAVAQPVSSPKLLAPTPTPMIARSVLQPQTPATTPEVPVEPPANTPATRPLAERRLRTIQEISPFYDTSVDKDIREFAVKQASEYNVSFGNQTYEPRSFPDAMYPWEPSNFWHYPLYFEDAVLERYGHTYHPVIQPAVSVAKFGAQLVFLPYQMTLDPPDCPKYALGWYRPGDCAPKLKYQPPLNGKAAAVQAGVVTGLFFLIP